MDDISSLENKASAARDYLVLAHMEDNNPYKLVNRNCETSMFQREANQSSETIKNSTLLLEQKTLSNQVESVKN